MNAERGFRRPASLEPAQTEAIQGGFDPAERSELAHTTANALVHRAREAGDPAVADRLVRLVESEGIDTVATLWSDSPANTLPGALWRLYLLQDVVRRDPATVAERFQLGSAQAPVQTVIAGVDTPPSPQDVIEVADAVLAGVFMGDLDSALERAAAFCRVLATGTAMDADAIDTVDEKRASHATWGASSLVLTADELEEAARLWRADALS